MTQLYEQEIKSFTRYLKRKNIDVHPMTVQVIVGFYQTYIRALQEVHKSGGVITQFGDKGQEIKKVDPHFTVMSESSKHIASEFKQIGITPRAGLEFLKLAAETTAMTPADEALQRYMDGGLPE